MEHSYIKSWKELNDAYEALSEEEKKKLQESSQRMLDTAILQRYASNLYWNRCVDYKAYDGKRMGSGEFYVYLWMHMDGTPFYVGSGKNGRWLAAKGNARDSKFIAETELMDSVVYEIVTGLEEKEARDVEFCVIHSLSSRGFNLAQRTYNYQRLDDERKERQTEKYERLKNERVIQSEEVLERILKIERGYDIGAIWREYDKNYHRLPDYIPSPQKRAAAPPSDKDTDATTRPPETEATEAETIIASCDKKIKEEK